MVELTNGQLADVLGAIRRWVDDGEVERPSRWLARLRGEGRVCSAWRCTAPVTGDTRLCHDHRPVFDTEPEPAAVIPERHHSVRQRIEALLRAEPHLADSVVAQRMGCSLSTVGKVRRAMGMRRRRPRRRAA